MDLHQSTVEWRIGSLVCSGVCITTHTATEIPLYKLQIIKFRMDVALFGDANYQHAQTVHVNHLQVTSTCSDCTCKSFASYFNMLRLYM